MRHSPITYGDYFCYHAIKHCILVWLVRKVTVSKIQVRSCRAYTTLGPLVSGNDILIMLISSEQIPKFQIVFVDIDAQLTLMCVLLGLVANEL